MIRKSIYWGIVLAVTALIILLVGESPIHVAKILFTSAFGSTQNIAYTLFYSIPLILTGTAVYIALAAGLFNIGAEGQLYMGALFAILWGVISKNWTIGPFVWIFGVCFSFLGGALWGSIAGYLKAFRQTHEVIVTIMLNFIAMAIVNWVILNPLKNPENQNLETVWISEAARIPKIWHELSPSFIFIFAICAFLLWIVQKTWWGFRVRATGANETAARLSGIQTKKTMLISMAVSGGVAGLVGFQEVFGNSYRLVDSFSPGFGFTGIAIALISRGNFLKMFLSTILFSALYKGALDLDLETERITRDLTNVIQALVLIALALSSAPVIKKKKVAS